MFGAPKSFVQSKNKSLSDEQ